MTQNHLQIPNWSKVLIFIGHILTWVKFPRLSPGGCGWGGMLIRLLCSCAEGVGSWRTWLPRRGPFSGECRRGQWARSRTSPDSVDNGGALCHTQRAGKQSQPPWEDSQGKEKVWEAFRPVFRVKYLVLLVKWSPVNLQCSDAQ